jgi:hypothetical protein
MGPTGVRLRTVHSHGQSILRGAIHDIHGSFPPHEIPARSPGQARIRTAEGSPAARTQGVHDVVNRKGRRRDLEAQAGDVCKKERVAKPGLAHILQREVQRAQMHGVPRGEPPGRDERHNVEGTRDRVPARVAPGRPVGRGPCRGVPFAQRID